MKVLVIGGLGFVGSHVSKELIRRGHEVAIYDNGLNPCGQEQLSDVEIIRGDILDSISLEEAVSKSGRIVNLAVRCLPESLVNPIDTHLVNDNGVLNLCIACRNQSKRLVHISSSEVYGTPDFLPINEQTPFKPSTPYSASKAAAEMIIGGFARCYGLRSIIVRPFNIYGQYMRSDRYSAILPRLVNCAKSKNKFKIFGDGKQTRDFTHVSDIAGGICDVIVLFPEGEIINLGSGKETSVLELVQLVSRFLPDLQWEFSPCREGDVQRHQADVTKAKKLIDWNPIISLEDGISKYARDMLIDAVVA